MKKSSLIIVSIVIFFILAGVGTFIGLVVHDLVIENKLEQEWKKLGYEEQIDMTIYSTGDYAKVERQVKLNFQTLYEKNNQLCELFEDETYLNLLTNQNYQKDGPNFEQSFIYLEQLNTKANALIKEIEILGTDSYIESEKNKIKAYVYYQDYFIDILTNQTIYFEFIKDAITGYQELSSTTNRITQILLFLRQNQDKWYIKDNVFTYLDESFYQQYLSLFNQIQEDTNQKDTPKL